MARLDVRRLANVKSVSLVVEMQTELLQDLSTAIVAPLVPAKTLPPIADVNPLVTVQGQAMHVRLEQLISIPRSRLGAKIDDLIRDEYQIMRALDRLLSRT